jgi:hypothetical protein
MPTRPLGAGEVTGPARSLGVVPVRPWGAREVARRGAGEVAGRGADERKSQLRRSHGSERIGKERTGMYVIVAGG